MKNEETVKKSGISPRTKDFIAKLLCIIGAFGIWYYAMSTDVTSYERDFNVPVEIENETSLREKTEWSVLSGKNSSIVVTLKGQKSLITKLADNDLKAYVDVGSVTTPGRNTLEINIVAPSDCEVLNTSVSSLSLYIDRRQTMTLPVEAVYSDYKIDSAYQLDSPVVSPAEITVSGPESELKKIKAARSMLTLGEVTQSLNVNSPIVLVDEEGNELSSSYINMQTTTVNVAVKLFATKEVKLSVDYKYGYFNDKNVKISISPETVNLRGEPSVLNGIDNIVLTTLDEKKFVTNGMQNVSITVPDGVMNMSSVTTADVMVEHIGTVTKEFTVTDIRLINTNGLNCDLVTQSVNVMFRGPYNILAKMTPEDISLTADMKVYTSQPGTKVVPVTVKIGSDYEGSVYELESYEVTVEIEK